MRALLVNLDALGPRICILGPSNSGKSTLTMAIARARDLPPVHLDQLYHRPNTDWQPRPFGEFLALHDAAIRKPRWVLDGTYTRSLPQRLERATGAIVLEVPRLVSLVRYLRRSWFERERHGARAGGQDSVTWAMIRDILVAAPANRTRSAAMVGRIAVPTLRLDTPRALSRLYRQEGLGPSPRRAAVRAPR